jgi:hypothetical protein
VDKSKTYTEEELALKKEDFQVGGVFYDFGEQIAYKFINALESLLKSEKNHV